MVAPFHLRAGDDAPIQQSSTTCGSASLTVARMLVDPSLAQWIRDGVADGAPRPDLRRPAERFAAHEQLVAGRTNGLFGPGGLQLPWPRALGTPPWGGRAELEHGAALPGSRYSVSWFRFGGFARLEHAYALLCQRVSVGRPALLYVGNAWLPRHVVLVLASKAGGLDVYEPSAGNVVTIPEGPFVERRLHVAGWDLPWAAVWPRP